MFVTKMAKAEALEGERQKSSEPAFFSFVVLARKSIDKRPRGCLP